jgi:hypothetical protein
MILWKQKPIFICNLWDLPTIRDMNQAENAQRNVFEYKPKLFRKLTQKEWMVYYDVSLHTRDRQ